jgi:hypothetical protein
VASAAICTWQVKSNEPSGISSVFSSEMMIALYAVQASPSQSGGWKASDRLFMMSSFTVQSGVPFASAAMRAPVGNVMTFSVPATTLPSDSSVTGTLAIPPAAPCALPT